MPLWAHQNTASLDEKSALAVFFMRTIFVVQNVP